MRPWWCFIGTLGCILIPSILANITADDVHWSMTASVGTGRNHGGPSYSTRPPTPLDVERYLVAPQGLDLEQVHVFVRHGERTPVSVRLSTPPASLPEHWIMCKTARRFHAAVLGSLGGQTELYTQKVVERKDGNVVEGECLLGELTDIGRQSTYNYGLALRKLYVERLGFLPDILRSEDDIYFRSTNIPRTIESLQQIVHGLYPTSKTSPGLIPPIRIRNPRDENLFGNYFTCPRLDALQIGFAKAAQVAFNPTLEPLDKKIAKYFGGKPLRLDTKPQASGILDTIKASVAHGIRVPPEFEDKNVIDVIEKAVIHEWFSGYETDEVRRLAMGSLLSDLSLKMHRKALHGPRPGDSGPKILVHTTHDTALAGLCSTLDVFDDKWPPFTASITFELFKRKGAMHTQGILQKVLAPFKNADAEHYVRMRFKNKDMILPVCADDGKHLPGFPEFCTLAAFRERVKELTPVDWEAECSLAGKS